jgi:DNA-binding transcriptional MocR family regulator
VKFAYASADFANPTGETLQASARQNILDLATELDIAVIEDAAYQSLRYDGDEVPPLLALDIERNGSIENTRTIYCGSFSKTLAPGLRVGWVCAAKPVISKLVLMKQAADLHSATLNQMAIHQVASDGFEAQVAKIKATYMARRDAMLAALARHMPEGVTWTKTRWRHVRLGHPARTFRRRGAARRKHQKRTRRLRPRQGLLRRRLRRQHHPAVVLLCAISEAMIEEGIKRLGRVVRGG